MLHVVHTSLDSHKQHDLIIHNIYKDFLFVDIVIFTPRGLNLVLPMCMGSSFGKVVKGWVGVVSGKLFYFASGAKLFMLLMWVHGTFFIDV